MDPYLSQKAYVSRTGFTQSVAVFFLSSLFLLSPVSSLIDQICINVGFENLKQGVTLLEKIDGSYDNFPTKLNDYCRAQFQVGSYSLAPLRTRRSSPSIGGGKYAAGEKSGSATLAFEKQSLALFVSDSLMPDCCRINDQSRANIIMYAVKHDGKFLNGWLSFEVHIKEKVVWAFVQMSDEWGNAIGEFVTSPEKICPDRSNRQTVATPHPAQFLPCTATGLQEAKPSQSVVYTIKDAIEDEHDYTMGNINVDDYMGSPINPNVGLTMRFTWRLNEYYCNRHAKFRVTLYFLTEKGSTDSLNPSTIFQRGNWLYPKWFGVADIVPKSSSSDLDCGQTITNDMIQGNKDKFWIDKLEDSIASDVVNYEREGPYIPPTLYSSCRTYLTRLQEFASYVEKQPSYGGRCDKIDEKKYKPEFYKELGGFSSSSIDVPHQCEKNEGATYPSKMENYKSYMDKKMKEQKKVCDPKAAKCPVLRDIAIEDIIKVASASSKRMPPYATGRYILKSRAYHGMVFTWAFLFLVPVLNFVARYFKETFLSEDIVGFRIWYFIHLIFSFLILCLSASGLVSNGKVSRVWGRSWSAAAATHRIMGWACLALFVIAVISGPFRPDRIRYRLLFMGLHAFLGYSQYLLGLFAILNSALIPGSPSASRCYKNITSFDPLVSSSFGNYSDHKIVSTVTTWIFIDLFFHALMNLMQWLADKSWKVKRAYYFPLVPIVYLHDRRSFKCFRYRTLVLILYVFILGIIVLVTSIRLYETDWHGCDCGPMTCTHASLSAESAFPEVQCGRLADIRQIQRSGAL